MHTVVEPFQSSFTNFAKFSVVRLDHVSYIDCCCCCLLLLSCLVAFDVLFSAVDIPICSTHLHINIGIKWQ